MELFGYRVKINADDEIDLVNGTFPDSHFNTFSDAFISVFIVLAIDGWSTIYFNHFRAVSVVASTIYFISLYIIGQCILLNLFLAFLVENFD